MLHVWPGIQADRLLGVCSSPVSHPPTHGMCCFRVQVASLATPAAPMPQPVMGGAAAPPAELPSSVIYQHSCNYFSRPLLEPQALLWQLTQGAAVAPWCIALDPQRTRQRSKLIESALGRCRSMHNPKLRETVYSMDVGAEATTSVAFHTVHPCLCAADTKGYVHVCQFTESQQSNVFHVTNGHGMGSPDVARLPPVHVNFMRQLNEQDSNLLMAGCTSGAVHVWRTYSLPVSATAAFRVRFGVGFKAHMEDRLAACECDCSSDWLGQHNLLLIILLIAIRAP